MPYAIRNSIILAILILIVNSIGWFVLVFPAQKAKNKITLQMRDLDAKLMKDAVIFSEIERSRKDLAEMRSRWQHRNKILPHTEDTKISYKYLHSIVMKTKHPFPFDFEFEDQRDTLGLSARKYSFRADVTFEQLFEFLNYFETNKRLMVIIEMQMDAKPPAEDDRHPIEMVSLNTRVVAYAAQNGTDEIASTSEPMNRIQWNPFKPLVSERLPKNEDGYAEVDRSKLVAISNKIAYMQDQQGALIAIKEGDPVYLGFVTRIDQPSASVEFTLNYGGFIRKRVLALVRESMTPSQVLQSRNMSSH